MFYIYLGIQILAWEAEALYWFLLVGFILLFWYVLHYLSFLWLVCFFVAGGCDSDKQKRWSKTALTNILSTPCLCFINFHLNLLDDYYYLIPLLQVWEDSKMPHDSSCLVFDTHCKFFPVLIINTTPTIPTGIALKRLNSILMALLNTEFCVVTFDPQKGRCAWRRFT